MTTLDDLLELLFIELPGCPQAVQKQTLRLTCRDFCLRTEAWRETLDAMDLVKDQADYELLPNAFGTIHRLFSVKVEDTEQAATGYSLVDDMTLRFATAPTADSTGTLVVELVLRPRFTTEKVFLPPVLFDRWGEAFADGAKARLMGMTGKPWADPNQAVYYTQRYEDTILSALIEGQAEYKADAATMMMERFV